MLCQLLKTPYQRLLPDTPLMHSLPGPDPVSYTHLDVYKRQDMFSAEGLCCEILARYEDVLTDPQAIANDFVYKMKYDNGQEATLVRTCLRSERMGKMCIRDRYTGNQ